MLIPGGFHSSYGEINFKSEAASVILCSEMAECLQSLEAKVSRLLPHILSEQGPVITATVSGGMEPGALPTGLIICFSRDFSKCVII